MTSKILNEKRYVVADPQVDINGDITYSYLTKDYHYIESSKLISRAITFESPEQAIQFVDHIPSFAKNDGIFVDLSSIGIDYVQVYELQCKLVDTTKIKEKLMTKDFQLTFGEALTSLKQGNKLQRKGWNGKGMYIYYVPAALYPAQRNKNKEGYKEFEDEMVEYVAYIALKNAQDIVTPWQPSHDDMLQEDWGIVTVDF